MYSTSQTGFDPTWMRASMGTLVYNFWQLRLLMKFFSFLPSLSLYFCIVFLRQLFAIYI